MPFPFHLKEDIDKNKGKQGILETMTLKFSPPGGPKLCCHDVIKIFSLISGITM